MVIAPYDFEGCSGAGIQFMSAVVGKHYSEILLASDWIKQCVMVCHAQTFHSGAGLGIIMMSTKLDKIFV